MNRQFYNDYYSKEHTKDIILFPLSYNFINSSIFPISFNVVVDSSKLRKIFEFYGYAQYDAYVKEDLIQFAKIKKQLNIILTKQYTFNKRNLKSYSVKQIILDELDKLSIIKNKMYCNSSNTQKELYRYFDFNFIRESQNIFLDKLELFKVEASIKFYERLLQKIMINEYHTVLYYSKLVSSNIITKYELVMIEDLDNLVQNLDLINMLNSNWFTKATGIFDKSKLIGLFGNHEASLLSSGLKEFQNFKYIQELFTSFTFKNTRINNIYKSTIKLLRVKDTVAVLNNKYLTLYKNKTNSLYLFNTNTILQNSPKFLSSLITFLLSSQTKFSEISSIVSTLSKESVEAHVLVDNYTSSIEEAYFNNLISSFGLSEDLKYSKLVNNCLELTVRQKSLKINKLCTLSPALKELCSSLAIKLTKDYTKYVEKCFSLLVENQKEQSLDICSSFILGEIESKSLEFSKSVVFNRSQESLITLIKIYVYNKLTNCLMDKEYFNWVTKEVNNNMTILNTEIRAILGTKYSMLTYGVALCRNTITQIILDSTIIKSLKNPRNLKTEFAVTLDKISSKVLDSYNDIIQLESSSKQVNLIYQDLLEKCVSKWVEFIKGIVLNTKNKNLSMPIKEYSGNNNLKNFFINKDIITSTINAKLMKTITNLITTEKSSKSLELQFNFLLKRIYANYIVSDNEIDTLFKVTEELNSLDSIQSSIQHNLSFDYSEDFDPLKLETIFGDVDSDLVKVNSNIKEAIKGCVVQLSQENKNLDIKSNVINSLKTNKYLSVVKRVLGFELMINQFRLEKISFGNRKIERYTKLDNQFKLLSRKFKEAVILYTSIDNFDKLTRNGQLVLYDCLVNKNKNKQIRFIETLNFYMLKNYNIVINSETLKFIRKAKNLPIEELYDSLHRTRDPIKVETQLAYLSSDKKDFRSNGELFLAITSNQKTALIPVTDKYDKNISKYVNIVNNKTQLTKTNSKSIEVKNTFINASKNVSKHINFEEVTKLEKLSKDLVLIDHSSLLERFFDLKQLYDSKMLNYSVSPKESFLYGSVIQSLIEPKNLNLGINNMEVWNKLGKSLVQNYINRFSKSFSYSYLERSLTTSINGKNIMLRLDPLTLDKDIKYVIINNENRLLDRQIQELRLNEGIQLELWRRWYYLPPDGPYDKMILPNDYPYNKYPVKEINTHPYPGALQGDNEILVSIHIISNVIDYCRKLWEANMLYYTRLTGEQALLHFVNTLYDWVSKYIPDVIYKIPEYYPDDYEVYANNEQIRNDYWRVYRWIRWYAEAILFNQIPFKQLNLLDGNPYIRLLIKDLIKYYNDHHGVYMRYNSSISKTKGVRHKWIHSNNKWEV